MSEAACRLCGGGVRAHSTVRGYRLSACAACGFVQVDRVPSPDELREFYSLAYFEKGKYRNDEAGRREQARRLALLADMGVKPGARVLDFGCATGEFLRAATDRYEVWGADISADALARAQSADPGLAGRLVQAMPDGRLPREGLPAFDAIVAWDVIEHLTDPAGVLHELAGSLRLGGVLVVSTPDIGAPIARAMGSRWAFMTPPEHLGFFSHASMRRAIESAGLETAALSSRGKWANLGFVLYKLRRVFPVLPEAPVQWLGSSRVGRWCLYVPTCDVLYAAARKPGSA